MLKIGHRGAPCDAPENTIPSFLKAIELGAGAVELDCHLSRDGQVIVIHDETLDRTTESTGLVGQKTLKEIKACKIRGGGEVPTLDEVLDTLGKDITVLIELKSSACGKAVGELLMKRLANGWQSEHLPIISFHHPLLHEIKTLYPALSICVSLVGTPHGYAHYAKNLGAIGITPSIELLDAPMMQSAKSVGLKTYAWTCNTSESVAKATRLQVDGIMTDDLRLLGSRS